MSGTNTVADVTNATYYAPLSSSGVGQWTKTTSFPVGIRDASCVASGSEVYCVGGYTPSIISAAVYYAPISSSGVGQWAQTISYPFPVWGQSCAASASEIYCVGGIIGPKSNTTAVYSAPLTTTGVGPWTQTTSYPVAAVQESCVTSGASIYCVGGVASKAVYYAPVSSSGVGQWTETTAYPFSQGPNYASCVVSVGEVYCVGGYTGPTISNAVYRAPLSSSGVGQWASAQDYPVGVWGESCVAAGSGIYCVGGETPSGVIDSVYHA
jgi:N-acetylneuraminic acid mutarotase